MGQAWGSVKFVLGPLLTQPSCYRVGARETGSVGELKELR